MRFWAPLAVYKKGKLDFHKALRPEPAQALYNNLMTALRSSYQTEKIKGEHLWSL